MDDELGVVLDSAYGEGDIGVGDKAELDDVSKGDPVT